MTTNRLNRYVLAALLALSSLLLFTDRTLAQERTEGSAPASQRTDTNYDVQLHLLVASNDAEGTRLPSELQPLIGQLRSSLPFRNYALGVTFINRVKDGGTLEVKGVANSLLSATTGSSSATNPATFYDFRLGGIRSETDAQGRDVVQIPSFRFGMRVPIQTGTRAANADGGGGFPVINYEPIGITTSVSLRDGAPVVIGTLTTNRTDQLMILVAQIKRAAVR